MEDDSIIKLCKMLSEVELESVHDAMDDMYELLRKYSEVKPKYASQAITFIPPKVTDRAVLRLQKELLEGQNFSSGEIT